MAKICIIIPVLNEEDNILLIYNKIKKLKLNFDILFIDDNSYDSSREKILNLKKGKRNIFNLFRNKRKGIGSAHKAGISWCYKRNYKSIITMDCDGTHDPKYIPSLIKNAKFFDLIITSRFKSKNSLKDWPFYRKFLTSLRLHVTKFILNLPYDTSGAFRCFNTNKIKLNDIVSIKSNNYDYFFESIYYLLKKKYLIYEVAINLPFRKLGSSKMNLFHIIQYFYKLLLIKFKS
jgi:dolichol-phosphate mannosyltransferase